MELLCFCKFPRAPCEVSARTHKVSDLAVAGVARPISEPTRLPPPSTCPIHSASGPEVSTILAFEGTADGFLLCRFGRFSGRCSRMRCRRRGGHGVKLALPRYCSVRTARFARRGMLSDEDGTCARSIAGTLATCFETCISKSRCDHHAKCSILAMQLSWERRGQGVQGCCLHFRARVDELQVPAESTGFECRQSGKGS